MQVTWLGNLVWRRGKGKVLLCLTWIRPRENIKTKVDPSSFFILIISSRKGFCLAHRKIKGLLREKNIDVIGFLETKLHPDSVLTSKEKV